MEGAELMALVLRGTVVTCDDDHRILDPGDVYVGDDGRVTAVRATGQAPPAGFSRARLLDTGGLILPGLIDLHNHLLYNTRPLWEAVGVPYQHHDRWVGERHPPDYSTSVTWPAKVLGQAAPEALLKYVEVKALIGGTTAIQGAPLSTRSVDGWLLRIIDNEKLPAGADMVMTAALQLDAEVLREERAPKLDGTRLLIYHVAEGRLGTIVHREFEDLEPCLKPGLIGVHATALTAADFTKWQSAVAAINPAEKATVVWSPFSNYWLYHDTTNVVEADKKGLRIALGSDWSPSGTKNVLGELKVADAVNRHELGGRFSDRELCDMVTANPGDALATAWGPHVGRLQRGSAADLLVLEHHDPAQDAYRNLIDATERHIRLVLVRGRPFYGTPSLMETAGATDTDTLTVAGSRRRVAVREPGRTDARLDWPGVKRALEQVRADPVAAWRSSQDALADWGGPLDDPEAPLALFGDMPEGDTGAFAAAGEVPLDLVVPRMDPLTHDAAFFAAVARAGVPQLQHLADYYR
ncbi:hypothetical protein [Streptomyces sp. NPDC017941]|uniref:hypothetical protein n=1 Tax=Streptomyces sp. NPDC017941 TaxID=3365018 RepID=UPI0037A9449E